MRKKAVLLPTEGFKGWALSLRQATNDVSRAYIMRDRAIRAAYENPQITRKMIAEWTGMSVSNIDRILDGTNGDDR